LCGHQWNSRSTYILQSILSLWSIHLSGSFLMLWNLHKLFELGMDVYFTSPIIMLQKILPSPILFQIC
jgi:hypothetical protein